MFKKKQLGFLGEKIAWQKYEKEHYKLLKKNYFCRGAELDLILWKEQTLVVVEVKMRKKTSKEILLKELIPHAKREALKKGVLSFLSQNSISYHSIHFELCLILYQKRGSSEIFIDSIHIHKLDLT